MDWPAYSPHLNPIEHVGYAWLTNCSPSTPPTCLLELRRALLDEWCNIPQDQIDNLILSMPRRCENAIQTAEIVNGVNGPDTVTANYVQYWFHRFRSCKTIVKNNDKITGMIEVDRHVSSRS
ncbi:transposable element Tcb2 transposase [Trichonephila clavipes]|nr:transposable element Tcb2 transposase [Trichonephila clavipes]